MSIKSSFRYVIAGFVLSMFLSVTVQTVQAEVKIKFWHAMSGKRIDLLKGMGRGF